MKVTLLFLAILIAVSHQQYNYRNYRMFGYYPWFIMPFPQQRDAFSNEFDSLSENGNPSEGGGTVMGFFDVNSRHNIDLFDDEDEEFSDIQSRIKGINRYRTRPFYSNNDQKARFFFNFPNNGVSSSFNNPLFKTAFFTSTITLSLNSIQSCVPPTEVIPNPAACRRRRQFNHTTYNDEQFAITPSETLKMMPTVLSSSQLRNLDSLISSSKEDAVSSDDTLTLDHLREKRFFINKNQFVVTSFSTTFVFVNATVTKTVNLLTTAAAIVLLNGNCDPAKNSYCVRCLPPGYVVC